MYRHDELFDVRGWQPDRHAGPGSLGLGTLGRVCRRPVAGCGPGAHHHACMDSFAGTHYYVAGTRDERWGGRR